MRFDLRRAGRRCRRRALILSIERFRDCGSNDSMTHSAATMKAVENDRQRVEADAGGQADRQRAEHHDRVLRVVDLRSVANQVGGADDAEGAGQAGADDQHDDRADDRQDDLRLDHRRRARRRAAPFRPERQRRAEGRGERQPHQRIVDLVKRMDRRDRPRVCCDCSVFWSAAGSGASCAASSGRGNPSEQNSGGGEGGHQHAAGHEQHRSVLQRQAFGDLLLQRRMKRSAISWSKPPARNASRHCASVSVCSAGADPAHVGRRDVVEQRAWRPR